MDFAKLDFAKLAGRYCIDGDAKFKLKDIDPADTAGLKFDKKQAGELLARGVERLGELQNRLYADDRWSLLVIFQAMDAAGKDGTIAHVMSGINPQGCQIFSFKAPSSEELDHDFLWRTGKCLPERGRIGIFNRSYYEEVLVVRVHPEFLARQRLPEGLAEGDKLWRHRFDAINALERHLTRSGTRVLKFFLHVSKEEQKKRFLERIDNPAKNWKFSELDVAERRHWGEYMEAYQEMIRHTGTKWAPWHVVPADNKWFTRVVVGATIVAALEKLDLDYPKLDSAAKARLTLNRAALQNET